MENIEHKKEVAPAEVRLELKQPSMYQVVMHNDDFTPMEFVVTVLMKFFHMDTTRATQVMYEVHTQGRSACGVYTRDVAETKVDQVTGYAKSFDHPLLCTIEVT